MAYTIFLKRKSGAEIALQELQRAVNGHPLLRLSQDAELSVVNPENGEWMSRETSEGDADIWIEGSQAWINALRWRDDGRVRVNASRDFDDPDCFLRNLLRQLAENLSAGVYGEEGEEYQ